jgi:hypothetical protein
LCRKNCEKATAGGVVPLGGWDRKWRKALLAVKDSFLR